MTNKTTSRTIVKIAIYSMVFLFHIQYINAQNSLLLSRIKGDNDGISKYRKQQDHKKKQELKEIFNSTPTTKRLTEFDLRQPIPNNTPLHAIRNSNGRTTASTDKLYLGMIRQDFDNGTKTYENSYAYRNVYESEQTMYEYYLETDQNGALSDTTKYEYYSIDPSTNRNLFFYRYSQIDDKLILTDYNKNLIPEMNPCGLIDDYSYEESFFSTIAQDSDTGEDYIFGNSHTLIKKDTSLYVSYNFSPPGDTTYIFNLKQIQGEITYYEQIFKQADGTIIFGSKSSLEYDENDNVVAYKEETWNTTELKWEIGYIESYTYNDNQQLISEEINDPNPSLKNLYYWEENLLMTSTEQIWDEANSKWINKIKEEYDYKEDTILIHEFTWEISTEEWEDNFYSEIIMSMEGEKTITVINKMLVIGAGSYENYQTDTLLNNTEAGTFLYSSRHSWNGTTYSLMEKEENAYDNKCRLTYESYIMPGQSIKTYYRYENPSDVSLASSEKVYESDDADISNGITWMLTSLDELKFEGEGDEAVIVKNEYYSRSSGTGTKYEYAYNENHDETKINYFIAEDPNPDDGIDYWLASEVTYTYDEDGLRTDWLFKKRNSKNDELVFFQKAEYINNEFGTDHILGYEYIADAWVFSDSSLYKYDADGYNTEYKREFYENDLITDGYINSYDYALTTFEEYCEISISGDSMLSNERVELMAMLGDGVDASYIWKDMDGNNLSETDKLAVDQEGDYIVMARNTGCYVSNAQRVYSICDMTISGDSVLIGGNATLLAQLAEFTDAEYIWTNSSDEQIAESASVTVNESGMYTVIGTRDFCYGMASKEVKIITGLLEDLNRSQINIYPNPSNGLINIKSGDLPSGRILIKLYSTQGKLVFSKYSNLSENVQLSLSNIKKGLYVLKIENGEDSMSQKVVLR